MSRLLRLVVVLVLSVAVDAPLSSEAREAAEEFQEAFQGSRRHHELRLVRQAPIPLIARRAPSDPMRPILRPTPRRTPSPGPDRRVRKLPPSFSDTSSPLDDQPS